MTHFIALIHKESGSSYGVSFPDVPGVTAAADSIDEALERAREVLAFAAEDWTELTGAKFPTPRTIDELRKDSDFRPEFSDAIVAAVPFSASVEEPA